MHHKILSHIKMEMPITYFLLLLVISRKLMLLVILLRSFVMRRYFLNVLLESCRRSNEGGRSFRQVDPTLMPTSGSQLWRDGMSEATYSLGVGRGLGDTSSRSTGCPPTATARTIVLLTRCEESASELSVPIQQTRMRIFVYIFLFILEKYTIVSKFCKSGYQPSWCTAAAVAHDGCRTNN
jgi:hypothetical protein